jgi:hypothetical protein
MRLGTQVRPAILDSLAGLASNHVRTGQTMRVHAVHIHSMESFSGKRPPLGLREMGTYGVAPR